MALVILLVIVTKVPAQTGLPDVFLNNSLSEQINYLDEHTRIYDNYRAIREDMFQKLKTNISDTLTTVGSKIARLNRTKVQLNHTIDTLKKSLETTRVHLDEMTRTKNSISVLGIEINKLTYNKIMWIIIAILVGSLLVGFFAFKRNLISIFNTKKEYQDLKNEFDTYRKTSREAREKMTMDHFNEIKRIKGGG